MMRSNDLIYALMLAMAVPAFGQGATPPDPVVLALDKNHNHELSRSEIRNAAKSLLKLDRNRDRMISIEELKPEEENSRQGGAQMTVRPVSDLMDAIDLDGSGDLSTDELKSASASLALLDADGDGKIDESEAVSLAPAVEEGFDPGQGGSGKRGPGGPGGPPPGGPRR